ncbi:MAG: amidohydrolase family protein [Akkermansia sp.]|nr:amidohydrolase family protein [Akkermansia sp.]
MGYFPRWDKVEPYYYSPRRIFGALTRAGVDEFIVSSTNAIWDVEGTAMHAEAREMKRLAGQRAHIFFWVSMRYLARDPDLSHLPEGLYEGFKLHGGESAWLQEPELLMRVLSLAQERSFPVQIHTGMNDRGISNTIGEYLPYCRRFPELHVDLAHGKPHEEVPALLAELPNVYIDTAFVPHHIVENWLDAGADERRIMFGSDLPAPQRFSKTGLSAYVRREAAHFSSKNILSHNAGRFLQRTPDGYWVKFKETSRLSGYQI